MHEALQKIHNARGLSNAVHKNPEIMEELIKNPAAVIEQVARNELPNTPVYRYVVWSLGAALLVSLAGTLWLALISLPIPDLVVAANAGALGALAGIVSAN